MDSCMVVPEIYCRLELMTTNETKSSQRRDTDAYLRQVGERVRTLRNQRGMKRKRWCSTRGFQSAISAQLELGKGNCSIVLLRRIARAIGVPVTQIVQEGSEPALDLVLLSQFLERLSPAALVEARDLLLQHFSEIIK